MKACKYFSVGVAIGNVSKKVFEILTVRLELLEKLLA